MLLGVQFTIAVGLIVATGFIRLQHDYMMNHDMGFDKRDLVAVRLSNTAARSYDVLRDRLLSDPRILDVTGAEGRLVNVSRMGWSREFKGRQVSFQAYIVKWNFLRMMGIPVTDGRDFLDSDDRKPVGSLICNEAARREFIWAIRSAASATATPSWVSAPTSISSLCSTVSRPSSSTSCPRRCRSSRAAVRHGCSTSAMRRMPTSLR